MALTSPGVEVTIIDESNYLPAPTNSVPFILVATAQNKVSGAGVGVAAGTTAANANKPYLISSQRDLAATFGTPFFYSTSAGTSINGYELNEYGLLAAYSVLGVSNRAYVQRADIDLSQLTATLTRPTGDPADGAYWLDTSVTTWGTFQWSATTETFVAKTPIVITSTSDLDSGVPKDSIGSIGDYAVVTTNTNNPVYLKSPGNADSATPVTANTWVLVGSDGWKNSWASIQSSTTNPTLTNATNIYLNDVLVTLNGTTVAALAVDINNASIAGVSANVSNGKLNIYIDSNGSNDGSTDDGNGILMVENGSSTTLLTQLGITDRQYYAPVLQMSPHYQNPSWALTGTEPHPTGSVWAKTTNVNSGANLSTRKYDITTDTFITQNCPIYANDQTALKNLDPAGGGKSILIGALYAQNDVQENQTYTYKIFDRYATGATLITGDNIAPVFVSTESFTIQASAANSTTLTTAVTAVLAGTTAADFVTAFLAANVANTTARVLSTGAVQIEHTLGGDIVLVNVSGAPVGDAGFITTVTGVRDGNNNELILSNWELLGGSSGYKPSAIPPSTDPLDGTYWYYSATDQADILINSGGAWKGYQNVDNDQRGYNLSQTSPNGPIVAATAPTTQSDKSALVYGDIWLSTADLDNYPAIYRWQSVTSVDQWVLLDNTDQTTQNGILFADARWAGNGTTDPITGDIPTIKSLLTSNYLDIDVPDSTLYPEGMLMWNTRRSGFNVKSYQVNYFNAADFPSPLVIPTVTDAWVTAGGNQTSGAMYAGRKAVRAIVVAAMKTSIDGQQELREEQRQFNLIATPNYPELSANMVALNNERSNTAFIIGDTPMRLADTGSDIIDWATNANGDGLTTADPYYGVFYPSCQTTDLSGNVIVAPPSHMMLRTIVRSDDVAYPWLAPAGTRRGTVDNATALGYVNAQTGEFMQTAIRQGLRDILYENSVNPITFVPGSGILNFGNKTTFTQSSLDRINVARLVAFIRGRLEVIGKNFIFEPNDKLTRDEIKNSIESLMIDLVAKRGLYDYLVVCDESNNTPTRIDRNELYVDVAIEPVKAVEFIYIPIRIKNTGEIASGQVATASAV
tara:strand:+ start:1122 stop:4385 length:3264 start_codon:yes stop_codon:yes gene_type:complete